MARMMKCHTDDTDEILNADGVDRTDFIQLCMFCSWQASSMVIMSPLMV